MLLDYHSAFYAGAGAVELAAVVAAESSVTASASVARPLAAAVAAESAVAALLTRTVGASAVVAAESVVAASLTVTRALAAQVAAQSGVGAALSVYALPPSATRTTAVVVASAATASVSAEHTTAAVVPQAATAVVAAQLATASVTAEAATAEVVVSYVSVAGDTLPVLTATLSAGGTPINLTGASVVCNLRIGGTRITKTATVTNAAGGVVTVTFAATDLVAGRGEAQFVITFGDGSIRTVPNSGENVVVAVAERL